MTTYPQKITFGELRETSVREVWVFCRDHRCSHSTTLNADRWPDHVRLSDIEPPALSARKRGDVGTARSRHRGQGYGDGS
jgi:hypothetical protein